MTATGYVYGNRYTLTERIAAGGMGEVWQAQDQVLGRIVAIKLLGTGLADQPGFAQRFREEARHTAALSHPNIAAVYDYGEEQGTAWLVMEYVQNEPLSHIIAKGASSPQRTVHIISQAAEALQAAHDAGVIHRDVKPANILVRPDSVVKLTDFGIARAIDAVPLTKTGEVMGTAQYISPEQAMGRPVSPASDVYSLGCVAYEMLTGRRPFDEGSAVATAMAHVHNPPPPLPPNIPPHIANIVMACLAKDPSQRPASGRALAAALNNPAAAPPPPPPSAYASTQVMGAPTAGATAHMAPPPGRFDGGYAAAPTGAPMTGQMGQYEQPKQSKTPMIIMTVVSLLLVGSVILFIVNGLGGSKGKSEAEPTTTAPTATSAPPTTPTSTTSSSSTTTTQATETVIPIPGQLIGQDLALVKTFLSANGIRYNTDSIDAGGECQRKNQVLRIEPMEARKGDRVMVTYCAVGPQPQPQPTQPTQPNPTQPTKTSAPGPSSHSPGSQTPPSQPAP